VYGAKERRMRRIFQSDGKALIVAMDHAGSMGVLPGLEHPGRVIELALAGGADAFLTTYGVITQFAAAIGGAGLILRADGGSTFLAKERGSMSLVYDVLDALRIGADAVGVMGMPGSTFEGETLPYLSALVSQSREWGLPVMAETLPGGFEDPGKMWTPENIGFACRVGVELGADFIKTQYSGDKESFRKIVDTTYAPIVILGGGKIKNETDLLTVIGDALQAGAQGVAIGRNIYQHPHPEKLTKAIAALIHDGASVSQAEKALH
jgi:DhnA family fructose-bisphosphate aldolase class Ia